MDAHKSDYQLDFDEDSLLLLTNFPADDQEKTPHHNDHHQNPPFISSNDHESIMTLTAASSSVVNSGCSWEVPGSSSSCVDDMLPIDGSEVYEEKTLMEADGQGVGFKIAFRTKSDLDVMDDGFRWRKYGKKKVKNTPNPRNYYRCTTGGCNVKKRVQREREDPRFVITTYEGKHNHESPGASSGISHNNAINPAINACTPHKLQLLHHPNDQQP